MKSKTTKDSRNPYEQIAEHFLGPIIKDPPTSEEIFEVTLWSNEKLSPILIKFFEISPTPFPSLDYSKSLTERKLFCLDFMTNSYFASVRNLTRRAYNYKRFSNTGIESLSNEEKHKKVMMIPEFLVQLRTALDELHQETPEKILEYKNNVYLTESMSNVVTAMFNFFDFCFMTDDMRPEYLSIIEQAINFLKFYGDIGLTVKLENKSDEMTYLYRPSFNYLTPCSLYNTYLNTYLIIESKFKGFDLPKQTFLNYVKAFKKAQKDYLLAFPDEKFVPDTDFAGQYFSLFNYYSFLANFYSKDSERFLRYLAKMMDAQEDFNVIGANKGFFINIDQLLDVFENDLEQRLLMLSVAIKVIDNFLKLSNDPSEERRLQVQFSGNFCFQGTSQVDLSDSHFVLKRKEYYFLYISVVSDQTKLQVDSLNKLAKQTQLTSFLDEISFDIFSEPTRADVHDVYTELKINAKNSLFAQKIMEQMKAIDIPCRLSNQAITIESSLLEIQSSSLKKAFLNAAKSCGNVARKTLDRLNMEEREKRGIIAQPSKPETKPNEGEKDLKQDQIKTNEQAQPGSKNVPDKKAKNRRNRGRKSKSGVRVNKDEKEQTVLPKGSFFNPSKSKPPFRLLRPGVRIERLRKSDSPCKYWAGIHPILVQQMNRENKWGELNRLQSQLQDGCLGKGSGVRGIIEGNTLKWDDPSRDCRYYGVFVEEYNDQGGKHVLIMLTTKVDSHSRKTPNIIIPPELKEECTKGLQLK